MSILVLAGLVEIGGLGALGDKLTTIDPALTNWDMSGLKFGLIGYLAGWFMAGFGVVGQPHVMVRMMTLDDPENMDRTRRIYVTWFIASRRSASSPGCARGCCSAASSWPQAPTRRTRSRCSRSCCYRTSWLAWPWPACSPPPVVIAAWSGLAATLGPLMIVRSLRWPINAPVALAMMAAGLATVLVWILVLDWSGAMYEALPGMAAGMLVYFIGRATVIGDSDGKAAG